MRELIVVTCALLLSGCNGAQEYLNAPPDAEVDGDWREYFGSHEPQPYSRSVRGVGRGALGPAAFTGPAPGEAVALAVRDVPAHHDVVLTVGGLGSGRRSAAVADYLALVQADSGHSWTTGVRDAALRIHGRGGRPERIYWQIGNEINSDAVSGRALEWRNRAGRGSANDPDVIPFYVETYFAPTVQGLRDASQRLYGSTDSIRVALGSVTQTGTPEGRAWLRQLLDYRIEGSYAPELAGRRVADLVDIVTVHYLVTIEESRWRTGLEDVWAHVGTGRLRGIWSTEELGRQRGESGEGAATALRVAARYLHWWLERGVGPDAGRCFFWGGGLGPEGSRGAEAMNRMHSFLGETRLRPVDAVPVGAGLEAETYAFTGTITGRTVVIVSATTRDVRVTEIRVPAWSAGTVRVDATSYERGRTRSVPASSTVEGTELVIRLSNHFTLPRRGTLALFLTPRGSRSE